MEPNPAVGGGDPTQAFVEPAPRDSSASARAALRRMTMLPDDAPRLPIRKENEPEGDRVGRAAYLTTGRS